MEYYVWGDVDCAVNTVKTIAWKTIHVKNKYAGKHPHSKQVCGKISA